MSYNSINEAKNKARAVDMIDFLNREGIEIKKNSANSYCSKEHNSLVFKRNQSGEWRFYWNSQGLQGDLISYVQLIKGLGFMEAVHYINDSSPNRYSSIPKRVKRPYVPKIKEEKPYEFPELADNTDVAFKFLVEERGLDAKLVQNLIDEKLILQTRKYRNILFPYYINGEMVNAEVKGTWRSRKDNRYFRGNLNNVALERGFTLKFGEPDTLYFFESTIDMLSFRTLMPNVPNCLLVSMAGLREEVVAYYTKMYPDASISFCIDNDDGGDDFYYGKMEVKYPNSEYWLFEEGKTAKDWNELLLNYKGISNTIGDKRIGEAS